MKKRVILIIVSIFLSLPLYGKQSIIKLPDPVTDGKVSLEKTINSFRSIRRFSDKALTLKEISQLLWASGGNKVDTITGASRTYPSAGAIYALNFYLIPNNVDGLEPFIYRYDHDEHALVLYKKINIQQKQKLSPGYIARALTAPAIIIIAAEFEKMENRYGERANDYLMMGAGHSGQNIYLTAVSKGLGTVAIGAVWRKELRDFMELPEHETPIYIYPVGNIK